MKNVCVLNNKRSELDSLITLVFCTYVFGYIYYFYIVRDAREIETIQRERGSELTH